MPYNPVPPDLAEAFATAQRGARTDARRKLPQPTRGESIAAKLELANAIRKYGLRAQP